MRGRIAGVEGTVDLRISYTIAGYFLPPLLARFKRACPAVDVRMSQEERGGIEREVISEAADFGVFIVNNVRVASGIDDGNTRALTTTSVVRSGSSALSEACSKPA